MVRRLPGGGEGAPSWKVPRQGAEGPSPGAEGPSPGPEGPSPGLEGALSAQAVASCSVGPATRASWLCSHWRGRGLGSPRRPVLCTLASATATAPRLQAPASLSRPSPTSRPRIRWTTRSFADARRAASDHAWRADVDGAPARHRERPGDRDRAAPALRAAPADASTPTRPTSTGCACGPGSGTSDSLRPRHSEDRDHPAPASPHASPSRPAPGTTSESSGVPASSLTPSGSRAPKTA